MSATDETHGTLGDSTITELVDDGWVITAAPRASGTRAQVVSEPLTYDRNAPQSYFRDLALNATGDGAAEARLKRHVAEMRVELPKLEQRARESRGPLERRVNPNVMQGQGGYGAPPLWLISETALTPRAKRVIATLIPNFLLPAGRQSINIPQMLTGTTTQGQVNLEGEPDQDETDAGLTSPVVVITGDADVSLQLLEQSPPDASLDHIYFSDMMESYDEQLEQMLIAGSGTGPQFTGYLTAAPTSNVITWTQATPTGSLFFPQAGLAYAQVSDKRKTSPECWLMRGARWAWIGTAEDTAGQPLAVPGHVPNAPLPHVLDDNVSTPVGMMLGVPIYTDGMIPATLGAGGNQDVVITCRPTDSMLWESEPHTQVMLDVLSGTLMARLQYRRYAAAVHRFPSGIGVVQGSGMIVASGY